MLTLNFILFYLFFSFISQSDACTPFDNNKYSNTQDDVDKFKFLLAPFKSIYPTFNNVTVPNLSELIEQYQLGKANEDVDLSFKQLVTKYGYPVEEHEVVTDDNYCLTMFRIPKPGAPVVFLMHGVACSSDDWITTGPAAGLGYVLSDAGYDVWFGNARGNKHSRRHLELHPECGEFWYFSFDEIGRYDLPAMIDYTLEATGKCQLSYIGHSQGTTSFYVMASERPEYNEKISIMVTLSAVIYMSHVRSPLFQLVAPFLGEDSIIAQLFGQYEIVPRDALADAIIATYCGSPDTAEIFCNIGVFILSGFSFSQLNTTILPVVYSHYPAGSALRQAIHYSQEVNSGKFRNYDHGIEGNLNKYGTVEPPDYRLDKVTCPVALFYSNDDWLTSADDIYKFVKEVPNIVEFYHVPCASFNHFDYLFAKDSDILVNREIKLILEKYAQ